MIVPNPGSDEAINQGCICPVIDNGRGSEELGRIRGFYYTVGCLVHDKDTDAKIKDAPLTIDETLDTYWDRIKQGDELITTIQKDTKKQIEQFMTDARVDELERIIRGYHSTSHLMDTRELTERIVYLEETNK